MNNNQINILIKYNFKKKKHLKYDSQENCCE